jgi:Acetyltransferase (GNAT) domain
MPYRVLSDNVEEHRERLLTLWKENMSDRHIADVAERRFPWYYTQNPAGPPTTALLLDDGSNQIVGSGSFYPRKVVWEKASLSMGVLADFVVDSAHRTAGAAVAIQRALVERSRAAGIDFLAGYPNRSAEPIFKRIGYKAVGKSERWVKPLCSRKKIEARLPHPLLGGVASSVVDFGLTALDLKRIAALSTAAKGLRGVYLDSCDERFDRLWERAQTAQTITAERTAAYLKWRYRDFPSLEYRFFALVNPATDRISAYLTFFVNAGNAAIVGDLFSDDLTDTPDALFLRFSAAERRAGRTAVCLDYLGPASLGERLQKLGFYRRPTDRSLFVYFDPATSQDMQRAVSDPSNWLMADGEMDI